jgi:hypothetical protein
MNMSATGDIARILNWTMVVYLKILELHTSGQTGAKAVLVLK